MDHLHSIFPSLSAELTKDNYVEKLRTLLFIEEFTAMQDFILPVNNNKKFTES